MRMKRTTITSVEGAPSPRVSWLKDGHRVDAGSELDGVRRMLSNGSLLLGDAQSSDAGRYTCLAQNVAGDASRHFDLQVYCECCQRSRVLRVKSFFSRGAKSCYFSTDSCKFPTQKIVRALSFNFDAQLHKMENVETQNVLLVEENFLTG